MVNYRSNSWAAALCLAALFSAVPQAAWAQATTTQVQTCPLSQDQLQAINFASARAPCTLTAGALACPACMCALARAIFSGLIAGGVDVAAAVQAAGGAGAAETFLTACRVPLGINLLSAGFDMDSLTQLQACPASSLTLDCFEGLPGAPTANGANTTTAATPTNSSATPAAVTTPATIPQQQVVTPATGLQTQPATIPATTTTNTISSGSASSGAGAGAQKVAEPKAPAPSSASGAASMAARSSVQQVAGLVMSLAGMVMLHAMLLA